MSAGRFSRALILAGALATLSASAFAQEWDSIVVHYSYPHTFQSKEDCDDSHNKRGFEGCGYHFIIVPDGSIEIGRDLSRVGAHAYGYNTRAIGVVLSTSSEANQEQFEALSGLIESLEERYGELRLFTHREVRATLCPGDQIHSWVNLYRDMENMSLDM